MPRLHAFLGSEFIASGASTEFGGFIRKITESKSKAEEHSHVQHELKLLAAKMSHPDVSSAKMKDYLICLVHCAMLGYSVEFGVIYAIMTTQSGETLGQRRTGYLACALFLEHDPSLGIMLINTLQRDLKSQQYLDRCAALNAIGYLQLPEMEDNLLQATVACLAYPKQIVRKKALLALLCFYQRSPQLLSQIDGYLKEALEDKDPSVVFAALSVWKVILKNRASEYTDVLPTFYRIFRQILENRLHRSFIYHGVLAPWAQIHLLDIIQSYYKANAGSIEEINAIVMNCLSNAERRVDAAYAIILSCTRVLGTTERNNEIQQLSRVIDRFLEAGNHNMKYLGLLCLEALDKSVWTQEWLNGGVVANNLLVGVEDDTLVFKSLDILNAIANQDSLQRIQNKIKNALETQAPKHIRERIAYWYLDAIYLHCEVSPWYISTKIDILAATQTDLDTAVVESHCKAIKKAMETDTEPFSILEHGVHSLFGIIKRSPSTPLALCLVQLACEMIGEYAYADHSFNDITAMKHMQKWIGFIKDDVLQIIGLQAIKQCIKRSKTWLPGLESILNECRVSPILEKQELALDLLGFIEDDTFKRSVEEVYPTSSQPTIKISANPNRPSLSRFEDPEIRGTASNLTDIKYQQSALPQKTAQAVKPRKQVQPQAQLKSQSAKGFESSFDRIPKRDKTHSSTLSSFVPAAGYQQFPLQIKENSMIASLLALELADDDDTDANEEEEKDRYDDYNYEEEKETKGKNSISTEEFGAAWVEYEFEEKRDIDCGLSKEGQFEGLCEELDLEKVELIGNELIASDGLGGPVLVHVAMEPKGIVQITARAPSALDLSLFMRRYIGQNSIT
ncbi:armadillo-type protein [Phycomyces blakesleeanus]|uniref:Armadillo-type protein n=1 Tax=Phycomyces blakesleeanus TaxID=4837 RepID=A0ABR3AL13_PHYBL